MTNVPLMLTPTYSDIAAFSPRSRQAVRCSTPCACRGYGIGRHARPVPALTGVAIASGVGRRVLAQLCRADAVLFACAAETAPPEVRLPDVVWLLAPASRRRQSIPSTSGIRETARFQAASPRAPMLPRSRYPAGRSKILFFPCLCPKSNRHAALTGVLYQTDRGKFITRGDAI